MTLSRGFGPNKRLTEVLSIQSFGPEFHTHTLTQGSSVNLSDMDHLVNNEGKQRHLSLTSNNSSNCL